jgi:hypothetical protein
MGQNFPRIGFTPLFCPYIGFSDVSWYQMPDESSQLFKDNDMEMPLY